MIIPRIKLHTRIEAEAGSGSSPVYVLIMYINGVNSYDTVTGEETGPMPQVPEELFLYHKYNNAPLASSLEEQVRSGEYVRLLEPDDLVSGNMTLFSSEQLIWSSRANARASQLGVTLMPAVTSSGSVLTRASAKTARAPFYTGNRAGYYKSRVYLFSSSNMTDVENRKMLMTLALRAFITKYLAALSYDGNVAELYETYDIEGDSGQ